LLRVTCLSGLKRNYVTSKKQTETDQPTKEEKKKKKKKKEKNPPVLGKQIKNNKLHFPDK
jgi:hypothetical protein